MYKQHFGLKKRPFRASTIGTDVFVGPQIAATMAGLKKALTTNDAIVTVSGPRVSPAITTRLVVASVSQAARIAHGSTPAFEPSR